MLVQKKINMMASRRNRCATPKDIFSHTDPTWVDITGRAEAEAGISHTAPPYATATATTTLVTNYSAVGSTWERFLPLTQLPYPTLPHTTEITTLFMFPDRTFNEQVETAGQEFADQTLKYV